MKNLFARLALMIAMCSGFLGGLYVAGGEYVGMWANVTGVILMLVANLMMPLFGEKS